MREVDEEGNAPAPTDDEVRAEWESLLDQPSGLDRLHPHMAVKPSVDVIPDYQRLIAIIEKLAESASGNQSMSPRQADALKSEGSSLICKIGNAASNRSEIRD